MVDIGRKIKELRTKEKITQNDLAVRLGVTKSTISSYENGSRFPSYDILIKISRVFKVSTDYLLGCADEKIPTINVSGLTDKQILSIENSINIYRAYNAMREQAPDNVKKMLDEFIELGTLNGQPIDFKK